jgi:hypothetical protein
MKVQIYSHACPMGLHLLIISFYFTRIVLIRASFLFFSGEHSAALYLRPCISRARVQIRVKSIYSYLYTKLKQRGIMHFGLKRNYAPFSFQDTSALHVYKRTLEQPLIWQHLICRLQ